MDLDFSLHFEKLHILWWKIVLPHVASRHKVHANSIKDYIDAERLSDADVWVVRGFLAYVSVIVFTLIISFHIGLVAIVGSKLTFYL
jgi:urea transporter